MIFSGGPIDIPCEPLGQYMTERFHRFGDREALVEATTGRSLTFRELSDTVRRCARGLSSLGFKKGDVLCMFSPNVLEYPVLFYAVASLGGIIQLASPFYIADELRHTFDLCKPKMLVTIPSLVSTFRQSRWKATVIVLGEASGCINFSSLISKKISAEAIANPGINPKEDVVLLLFSSGTTGKPKAVQATHYGVLANALQFSDAMNTKESDVFLTILPLFHSYGLKPVTTSGLYAGVKNVIMTKFEPKAYLSNIQKYRATVLHVVPPVLFVLTSLSEVAQYDLSSVCKLMSGAAPLSKEIEAKTCKMFRIEHISQGYGMTEYPVAHTVRGDNFRFGSVGTLLRGTECKIMDVGGKRILAPGQDGEIYIRGLAVMKGYLDNPQATSAMIDKDGWLRTGDIGHVDRDGFLFVVDRIKELIKYKGFQVAPAELEDILLKHPDVADVGVIGVPDVEAGELPKAFVVRTTASCVSEKELVAFVASKVSATKRLRGGVTFLPEIPKSPSGKILRRLLRDKERTRSKL